MFHEAGKPIEMSLRRLEDKRASAAFLAFVSSSTDQLTKKHKSKQKLEEHNIPRNSFLFDSFIALLMED